MYRYRALWGILILVSGLPACGQAQQVQRITFDEALRLALRRNPAIQQAANERERSEVGLASARSNFLPDINLSVGANRDYGRNFVLEEGRLVNQITHYFSSSISANLNLFNGFRDLNAVAQARLQVAASELNYARQRETVLFNVLSTFLSLIEAREQVHIQEENLAAQRALLEQIEAFVQVGSRPMADLYQQQAQVAAAELELINARRNQQLQEANLIQLLQLDPFGAYEFVIPEVDTQALGTQEYDVQALLQAALARRSDLRALEERIQAAEYGVRVARSTYWPTISLRASYGSSYTDLAPVGFQDQFFDRNRRGSIGLSLTFPVFDRFTTRHNVQRAQIELENTRLQLQQLRQEIATQVRQAYLDYETARQQYRTAQVQLQAARQALQAAQERYNVGAATLVELTQARATYVRAEADMVRARYTLVFRQKLIDYYVGTLVPELDVLP
ncbi:MAG: TolC family protein [Rhodothermus sp.]|nr:TolC family protein [Rhodothermus sp.]